MDKVVIQNQEMLAWAHGDKEPKVHKVWNLIPLKQIIHTNISEMISACWHKTTDYRLLYNWLFTFNEFNMNEKNREKLQLLKRFAMQCEHAYVIREERLKEFQIEYENDQKYENDHDISTKHP